MALRLCASCMRHVRDTESSCPFCDAALSFAHVAAPIASTSQRLSRAAQVAFVASVLVGCRDEAKPVVEPPKEAPTTATAPVDTGVAPAVIDAEPEVPPVASATVSASVSASAPTPAHTPTAKPPPPPPNLKKPYGAPPADGLLT